jgi:hypothetical protein
MQYSTTLRNNQLDQIESSAGASAFLQFFSGALPANCAAADSGTMICEIALPADWMAAAGSGSVAKNGTWSGSGHAAAGAGTDAVHFRIKNNAKTVTHIQGTVSDTGGGGEMTCDNANIASGQAVTVTGFTITAGNA